MWIKVRVKKRCKRFKNINKISKSMIGRPSHILIFKFEDAIKINDGRKEDNKWLISTR